MLSARSPSRLRLARQARHLSQQAAATKAGVSICWLRQVEAHPDLLTERIARALAKVYRVPVDQIRSEP